MRRSAKAERVLPSVVWPCFEKVARASKYALTGLWVGFSRNVLIGLGLRVTGQMVEGLAYALGRQVAQTDADSLRE